MARTPRPVSHYAGKCRTRAEVRDKLRATSSWSKMPLAWLPEICRINVGGVAIGVILCIAAHTKGKCGRAEWGKIGESEWSPELLDRDIAAELQVSVEAVRDEKRALIERGIIGQLDKRHCYKLLPENWPALKRPEPKEEDETSEGSQAAVASRVTVRDTGEEEGNTHGATAPPVQQLPLAFLNSGEEPKLLATVAVNEACTFRVSCRHHLPEAVGVTTTITGYDIVVDLSPGSPGEPPALSAAADLTARLAALGYTLDAKLAKRLAGKLPAGCTPEVACEVVRDRITRAKAKPLERQMLLVFFAEDLPGKWKEAAGRLSQVRAADERARGANALREREWARQTLASDDPIVTDEDREWARGVLAGEEATCKPAL